MLIYLEGCSSYYKKIDKWHLATDWRGKATNCLSDSGHKTFDPTIDWDRNLEFDGDLMVEQNEYYLKAADIILVNLNDLAKSYGSIFELVTAHVLGKPIIAFGNNKALNHPHIRHIVKHTFSTLDEALNFILLAYCQN